MDENVIYMYAQQTYAYGSSPSVDAVSAVDVLKYSLSKINWLFFLEKYYILVFFKRIISRVNNYI